jgi:Spy/CpxP family protein refolding chaperone
MNGSAKQKAALWVGGVFLLGAALGGVLGYVLAHRTYAAPPNATLSESEKRAHRVAELTRELSLTPQQAQQVDAIILQGHTQAKAIRDQTEVQIDQVRQKARAQIQAILTPDQLPKLEEFIKRRDQERKRNGLPPERR